MERFDCYSGMGAYTADLTDMFVLKASGKDAFKISLCARMDGAPHIGTLINMMVGFALALKLKNVFGKQSTVFIELLDNVSDIGLIDTFKKNDRIYFYKGATLKNSVLSQNLHKFLTVLERLKTISSINYIYRNYYEKQDSEDIRSALIEVIDHYDYFRNLFQPSDKTLHIRTSCPVCGLIEKTALDYKVYSKGKGYVEVSGICPMHGEYKLPFTKNNKTYIDINVPLREFTRGITLVDNDVKNNTLSIIVDGNDWGGIWPLKIYCEGIIKLNRKEIPNFLYTPLIFNNGVKLAKSKIVQNNINNKLYDTSLLTNDELIILWNEIIRWFSDTKCFFCNYELNYFQTILKTNKPILNKSK